MSDRDYSKIFEQFSQLRIMIVGDVMVDAYIWGVVDRISPEAPVPVVRVERRSNRMGGAANVALNIKSLGAEPILCSVIGDDMKGREFLDMMEVEKLSCKGIFTSDRRPTTTKFRIFGNNTQMLRVDEEITADLETEDQARLKDYIFKVLEQEEIHAIIFQDYNKGILTAGMITGISEKAREMNIPMAVDPKRKNFTAYKHVALFKPNLKELREGLNRDLDSEIKGDLEAAVSTLHKEQDIRIIMTTLSEAGVFVSSKDSGNKITQRVIPAHVRSIADVSGAGDTVISVAALCLAAGLDPFDIAAVANLAGGIVCEEVGVVPIDREKLLTEVRALL
jgi:rfaE bifunctional protein kinase chain/domain